MISLLMLQVAKLAGAAKLALWEPVEKKREMGRQLGADVCIDPLKEDVAERLADAGMTWIRTVIECAGLPSTMKQAMELTLRVSYINPCTQQRALQLIDSGRLDVESMVCRTIGMEQLEEALCNPKVRAEGKYIVSPEM